VFGLPSDYGVPVVSGLVFGMLLWLAAYLVVPAQLPQLLAIAAPGFIVVYMVYGTVTGLLHGLLHRQPYAEMN
jgi:hypothetical protein